MAKQIRMPDRAQRLYTERDYLDALCRAGGDEKLALAQEEERGCGFGFLYLDMLTRMLSPKRSRRLRELLGQVNAGSFGRDGVKRLCDTINKEFSIIRNVLTQSMQAYIHHKGYVDVWPVPGIGEGFSAYGWDDGEKTQAVQLAFDFFSYEFHMEEKENKYVIGRYSGRTLNTCRSSLAYPKELEERDNRIKELKRVPKPTKSKQITSNIKMAVALLPLILLVLFAAVIALWYVTGTEPDARGILALILIFPAVFYPFLSMHPGVLWGSVIASVVTGVFSAAIFVDILDAEWISGKEYRRGVAAAAELERLEHDENLARMEKDYYRRLKEENEFARMWHQEWLTVCKAHL